MADLTPVRVDWKIVHLMRHPIPINITVAEKGAFYTGCPSALVRQRFVEDAYFSQLTIEDLTPYQILFWRHSILS